MKMKSLEKKLEVMQAFRDGAKIQRRRAEGGYSPIWQDITNPNWMWGMYEYRVKPSEPRTLYVNEPRTLYVNEPLLYRAGQCLCAYVGEKDARYGAASVHDRVIKFVEVLDQE